MKILPLLTCLVLFTPLGIQMAFCDDSSTLPQAKNEEKNSTTIAIIDCLFHNKKYVGALTAAVATISLTLLGGRDFIKLASAVFLDENERVRGAREGMAGIVGEDIATLILSTVLFLFWLPMSAYRYKGSIVLVGLVSALGSSAIVIAFSECPVNL